MSESDESKKDRPDTESEGVDDEKQTITTRQLADAYNQPGDYSRENANSLGDVTHIEHGDGPMQTHAEARAEGAVFQMSGRPPQAEEGTKEVCIRLARALTCRTGHIWKAEEDAPSGPERGIDWFLRDADGVRLPVQVTRVGRRERWAAIASRGSVRGTATAAEAAADIWEAIERKMPTQDAETVLALNVGQPGYYGFSSVVDEFRRRYDCDLRKGITFREVWLVGYSLNTTCRIHPL